MLHAFLGRKYPKLKAERSTPWVIIEYLLFMVRGTSLPSTNGSAKLDGRELVKLHSLPSSSVRPS